MSLIDFSGNSLFFDTYFKYCEMRSEVEEGSYSHFNSHYNEYGDICITRKNSSEDAYFDLESTYVPAFLTSEAINRLNSYYDAFTDKGIKVLFSYWPINRNAMDKVQDSYESASEFSEIIRTSLHADIISDYEDYVFDGEYFYDADYHLSDDGALLRTNQLLSDLSSCLRL